MALSDGGGVTETGRVTGVQGLFCRRIAALPKIQVFFISVFSCNLHLFVCWIPPAALSNCL